eukprot:3881734-Pyramimonas_sp.AAC.1
MQYERIARAVSYIQLAEQASINCHTVDALINDCTSTNYVDSFGELCSICVNRLLAWLHDG